MIIFLTAKKIDSTAKERLTRSLDIIPSLQAVQNKRVGVIGGENLMGVGPGVLRLVGFIQTEGQRLLDIQ